MLGSGIMRFGKGDNETRGKNNGLYLNIIDGTPFNYSGEVISAGIEPGSGIVIATDDGETTINDLGPVWYWQCNEIDRPVGATLGAKNSRDTA